MFRSRDVRSSSHRFCDPQKICKICARDAICTASFAIFRNRCACHEVGAHRQRPALRLPRNLHVEVHPTPRLPRNLHVEVHPAPREPRNLHFEVHEVLRLPHAATALQLKVLKVPPLPRNYWRCSKCCVCYEICIFCAQNAAPATKSAIGGAQSAARATKSAHPDSHRAGLRRQFAVTGRALCEMKFLVQINTNHFF